MKPIHTIIAASLILNVVLFICAKPFASRAPVVPVKTQAQKPGAQDAPAFNLKTISPEQLKQKLTDMGFPPDAVRSIVRNRIYKIFLEKYYSTLGYDDPRYWRQPQHSPSSRTKYNEAIRERNEMMEKLLGENPSITSNTEYLRRRYGDLSDEKLRAIADIDATFSKK